MKHQEPKYFYTFVPSLIIAFAFGFYGFISFIKKIRLDKVGIAFIVLWFIYLFYTTPVYYVQGYEKAGKYVAENSRGKSVLFYGWYDGTFMMGVRRVIPKGGPYILRGERQLAVRVTYGNAKESVVVKAPDDIIQILNKYRTGYIVAERNMPTAKNFPEYNILIRTINDTTLFKEVARFPIKTNYGNFMGSELVVYKFRFSDLGDVEETLKIPVPTLQRTLEVPLVGDRKRLKNF